jgi:hypothetical protein
MLCPNENARSSRAGPLRIISRTELKAPINCIPTIQLAYNVRRVRAIHAKTHAPIMYFRPFVGCLVRSSLSLVWTSPAF